MKHRVHWFSVNDLSVGFYLPRIEEILHDFKPGNEIRDVNDILELYEITKFVAYKAYPKSWGHDELSIVEHFKPNVAKYFKRITKLDFPNTYRLVDICLRDTFWEVIDVFGIKGLIDENSLREAFSKSWELREFMYRENLVERHGSLMRKLLKSNPHSAEWLLDEYVAEHSAGGYKSMFFPKDLTEEDVLKILEEYISSDDPNLNYVRLLEHTKMIHTFKVSPSIRL